MNAAERGSRISVHVRRFYFWQEHVWLRPPFTLVPMDHNLNFRRRERPPQAPKMRPKTASDPDLGRPGELRDDNMLPL